ncbi:Dam family site-specific DNA-(adenine-N6)-methyltransferase [Halomonas sp. McH1-25]|uniref:DNA adenine methylase n=1 Tax=unclassified Halomonas TaxID=2609666 RepID=UPI001EF66373|nr:Dam family site-specific DNA-(adenine-N6)-methyltransferase [Halomonas sp. McH1-25]MCP1340748.1 Dam family site-specific DNA-(adenine-N6)-methyltransferase [Halomonas sp. FL8]MCP1359519.1 Dam family site-specific DNA-(adenine-N6)-methyltransferase [Halomonas sp. BBD45]MCP1363869.1 Dam family site-specific DNA-(adenine-N6)-methyltransferase [Halomonas sp. BBD48]
MYKQIIRWAGSKKKLLPQLVDNVPASFSRYVEPFCGSACLFFEIQPKKALLCDINEELINALRFIREDECLHSKLLIIPNTKEEYYRIRALPVEDLTSEERALRFLYLNRYCFNGVYRTNKKGVFNVPRGTKTGGIPDAGVFERAKDILQSAEIRKMDYKQTVLNLKEGDFVYLDPPYSKAGRFTGEYGVGSMNASEIDSIANCLYDMDKRGIKFLLSYKNCEDFLKLISGRYRYSELKVKRHVSGFKAKWSDADEILVKNYE